VIKTSESLLHVKPLRPLALIEIYQAQYIGLITHNQIAYPAMIGG